MTSNATRLPVSRANAIIISLSVAGAITTGILHSWIPTVVLSTLAIGQFVQARLARDADSSDRLRLNSLEYRDERDRDLARTGFAAVGIVALSLAMIELVVASVFFSATPHEPLVFWTYYFFLFQLLVFGFVWSRTNRAAAEAN